MDNLELRKADRGDAARIMEIIDQAKAQMAREGRKQWTAEYPALSNILADIDAGTAHVLCAPDGRVVAYCALVADGEAVYRQLDGHWRGPEAYMTVHRLAVADEVKRRGVATALMQRAAAVARGMGLGAVRADTNFDNVYMQHIFARLGYEYIGEVVYPPDSRRLAYEKVLEIESTNNL